MCGTFAQNNMEMYKCIFFYLKNNMSISLKTDLKLIDQQHENERPFEPLLSPSPIGE